MGLGGAKPPKQKYNPPNERKPISRFWLGLIFLLDLSQKKVMGYRI